MSELQRSHGVLGQLSWETSVADLSSAQQLVVIVIAASTAVFVTSSTT